MRRIASMNQFELAGLAYQYLITQISMVEKRQVIVVGNSMGANLVTTLMTLPSIQSIYMLRGVPYLEMIKSFVEDSREGPRNQSVY